MGQIHIRSIYLIYDFTSALHHGDKGHKVTCMINGSTYLGRAQDCRGSILKWRSGYTPRLANDFQRLNEDATDLAIIRHDPNKLIMVPEQYIPDGEGYSNPHMVLPYTVSQPNGVRMQFYDLKYLPPRCIDCTGA